MPLNVKCNCGKMLKVPEAMAGKRGRCPACNGVVAIPSEADIPDAVPVDPVPPQRPEGIRPRRDEDEFDRRPRGRRVEDEDDRPAPRRRCEDDRWSPRRRDEDDQYSDRRRDEEDEARARGPGCRAMTPGRAGAASARRRAAAAGG